MARVSRKAGKPAAAITAIAATATIGIMRVLFTGCHSGCGDGLYLIFCPTPRGYYCSGNFYASRCHRGLPAPPLLRICVPAFKPHRMIFTESGLTASSPSV